MSRSRLLPWAASLVVVAGAALVSVSAQAPIQRILGEYVVAFEFEQRDPTVDQITIVFSNRAVNRATPPRPVFGDDILQEFSFSGRDFPSGPVRFSRRVRDRSFADARYIRVVNHGVDRWEPVSISLSVDGARILNRVPIRIGQGAGIAYWNRSQWSRVSFWEAELSRLAAPARRYD
jgi:hypothetical protein